MALNPKEFLVKSIRASLCIAVEARVFGRGRDASCPAPPAQIRAGSFSARGSYRGCLASKRKWGYG